MELSLNYDLYKTILLYKYLLLQLYNQFIFYLFWDFLIGLLIIRI